MTILEGFYTGRILSYHSGTPLPEGSSHTGHISHESSVLHLLKSENIEINR